MSITDDYRQELTYPFDPKMISPMTNFKAALRTFQDWSLETVRTDAHEDILGL